MPIVKAQGRTAWRVRDRRGEWIRWALWLCGVLIFTLAWTFISERTLWAFVTDAPAQGANLIARMIPPDVSIAAQLVAPLVDTVNIATLGTLLAILIGAPIAVFAARNTSPSSLLLRPAALFVIVASRSVNSLIWALLLVTILGPGVLAGVLAIGLRSIGFVGKLLYEAIEEIDEKQVEAIRATGASRAQIFAYGIVPQILPAFATIAIFRWDINIRESTVLGLVGAGGIGLQLNAAVSTLAWGETATILLLILAMVILAEVISTRVRSAWL
jgi:phosphonate transport system permease protein